jgi:rapamycin-insensitive companion of mTOR
LEYCINVEQQLVESLSVADHPPLHIPPHFYHELASTANGCDMLDESNCFCEIWTSLRNQEQPSFYRRAALWAIGNIGRSPTGLKYLLKNEPDLVGFLCELAASAPCLALRGTCFFALGLLSSTEQGRELLDDNGWESPDDVNCLVAVPKVGELF